LERLHGPLNTDKQKSVGTMLNTINRFTSSLMGLLRESEDPSVLEDRLEDIREAMLDRMAVVLEGQVVRPAVWAKVLHAIDVQGLWYQRSAVMHLLSDHMGEAAARAELHAITELFRGVLPDRHLAPARKRP
jgi:hypothetical protein